VEKESVQQRGHYRQQLDRGIHVLGNVMMTISGVAPTASVFILAPIALWIGGTGAFWAFIVALVLFLLGGAFAIYEGIEKLRHPHEIESLWWAVGVLLIALVMEGFSLRTAVQEARKVRGDHGWVAFIRRAKAPEIPVVLLEDVGALTGLVLALSGVSLAKVTGNPRWDALGSLAIGILLCVIAIVLAAEMKSLLIGEAASPGAEAAIRDAFAGADGVRGIIHLRTEHVGPEDLLVAAKLEFDRSLSMAGLALCHHPQPQPGAYVLAGHLHPCVVLGGRAHQRLRLPCFHFGEHVGVLPAFGAFTGMHALRPRPGERVFVVGDGAVSPLPVAAHPTLTG